ncbi:hypothetical protein PMAYCL1PPCAC_03548, partial [Pristionchus mayeri]
LKGIEPKRDFWDAQKSLRKAWWAGMKKADCPRLSQWYKSFFNHLFYVNKKFPNPEDRPLALEYVRSFIKHCTGQHRWRKGDDFNLITKCDHSNVRAPKRGNNGKGVKAGQKGPQKSPKQLIEVYCLPIDALVLYLY